ncbi:MAG: metallophosphoesterase [Bacteroidales bacterium]
MMNNMFLKSIVFVIFGFVIFAGCDSSNRQPNDKNDNVFSFVFMTDIHLQPERNAIKGFKQAIDSVNKLNPDFVITGGDLIMDALGQGYGRADSLYNLYIETSEQFKMPVYNTMGNHEIFGIYDESGIEDNHPEYGERMYEGRIGKRYYSFDHKGWHFMILDAVEDSRESSYIGLVDSVQMAWIAKDLESVDPDRPIAISVHMPFITSYMQIFYGSTEANGNGLVTTNAKDVMDLFTDRNLKLVLQGHLHFLEDIYANGIHFITGGAVSSKWWSGRNNGLEEGFLMVHIDGEDFTWEYIDFGWKVNEEEKK